MKAVKTIAALIFLAAVAVVLVQPVLGAGEEPSRDGGRASGETSGEGSGEGSGEDDQEADEGQNPPVAQLQAVYPKRCMRDERGPATGLVAARRGSTATVGLPADPVPLARIDVDGDAAWSPSGRYLAESGGQVFDQRGTPEGRLFFRPVKWQWSPVSDCALAVTESGSLSFSIPGTRRHGIRLVDDVTDFELSPNGRRLAYVVRGEGLWIAELRQSKWKRVTTARVNLAGWYSNRSVMFAKGTGKLRYSTGSGDPRIVKGAFATSTPIRCADRTLLVALASEADAPLAELTSRRGRIVRRVLPGTPGTYDGFSDAACSPDGGLVVASAVERSEERGPLVLLQADGTFVREIMAGRTANPTWTADGVLFVSFEGDRGRLWFVTTTGAPAATAYTVGAPNQYDWHAR